MKTDDLHGGEAADPLDKRAAVGGSVTTSQAGSPSDAQLKAPPQEKQPCRVEDEAQPKLWSPSSGCEHSEGQVLNFCSGDSGSFLLVHLQAQQTGSRSLLLKTHSYWWRLCWETVFHS